MWKRRIAALAWLVLSSSAYAQFSAPLPTPVVIADSTGDGPMRSHSVRQVTGPKNSFQADSNGQGNNTEFTTASILDSVGVAQNSPAQLEQPWWQRKIQEPISNHANPVPTSIDDLIQLGLINAAKLKVAEFVPQIRRTAVTEASADFDWDSFISTMWRDSSDPIGSSLTVGGNGSRFRDHDLDLDYGLRKRNLRGGNLELLNQWGYQDNNSTFFIPNDQATSRMVLRYTQPLMRGRGVQYNQSLIVLARIDVESAGNEYTRQLQSHLLEIARGYWGLYLERANLNQKIKLYLRTKDIADQLAVRQKVDAARSQVARAQAALELRSSDLIRARTAIKNAETRLRALVNAPELAGNPEQLELIPSDHPVTYFFEKDLEGEFQTAMHNRPEIRAAINSIRAASVRLNMAQHEIMPLLNVVTESYLAGLRGNTDFGNAWVDQFRTGEPSYSVGLEFEMPFQRRAARARLCRRRLEAAQLQEEYRNVLELTRAEVEVAVRELETSHRELLARSRALKSAELEAETIEYRWKNLADPGTTGGLLLDSLLRAQERVAQSEFDLASATLTYNLAIINLRHANGTLFQTFPMEHQQPSSSPASTFIQPVVIK